MAIVERFVLVGQRCRLSGLLLLLVAGVGCSPGEPVVSSADLRLYVFNCGELTFQDISAFGLSNEQSPTRELFVPCYLIDHPQGRLFWDAGLDPALVGQGQVVLESGGSMHYERSVIDQLAGLDLRPADIDMIALSHMHFDHVGAARFFDSRLLIQRAEYEAAFLHPEDNPVFDNDLYVDLADNPRTLLEGDHDVFGDGRVRLLSAPGHTPGHQVLFVDLANTGPLLLSGDLYHFRESRSLKATPVFNTDTEETLRSMQKIEAFLAASGATLWIEHDKALAESLNLAPAFYD